MIETEPRKYTQEELDSDDYVLALCECPLPIGEYGIVIDRRNEEPSDGWYEFKCKKCGLKGRVYARRDRF